MKIPKDIMISCCGICCSLCPGFRHKTCPGCRELKECKFMQCATNKKIDYCFLCKEFPCQLFEKGFEWDFNKIEEIKEYNLGVVNWKPFSSAYVKLFKLSNIQKEIKKNKKL